MTSSRQNFVRFALPTTTHSVPNLFMLNFVLELEKQERPLRCNLNSYFSEQEKPRKIEQEQYRSILLFLSILKHLVHRFSNAKLKKRNWLRGAITREKNWRCSSLYIELTVD